MAALSNGHSSHSEGKGNSATTTLAEFISNTKYEDLNVAVVEKVKELLLDIIGVASAAAGGAESSAPFVRAILEFGGPQSGTSTVFAKGHSFGPQYAALLNAAFAHSFDFDDTLAKGAVHPGSSVVPAALVQGESSKTDGKTLLTALAVGYEVICRIAVSLGSGAYSRGFHNTGTAGIFGAIAAIASIKTLPSNIIENAFGLAVSKAAGSMSFMENGSWNKRLHPGFASHDALLCITLAEAGVLGSSKALEGSTGFLNSYSDSPNITGLTKDLGKDWVFMGTALKPYPACRVTHASIDLAAQMASEHDGPVEKITVALEPAGYKLVGRPAANKIRPENIVDAQFSNYIQTAIAWLHGNRLGWSAYERIFDSDVQELARRIEHVVDSALPVCGTKMSVLWQDGTQREEYMEAPVGEVSNPFVFEKVQFKYLSLAVPVYGEDVSHRILEIVKQVEEYEVTDLMSLL